ncbi:SDR family NAD(P)-dependent oxidoreductase [Devosia sp. A369]
MQLLRIDGRRALVTGAARGIGRAIALALHDAGAQVLAHDRDADELTALTAGRSGMTPVVADLGLPGAAENLVIAAKSYGAIDILVLCASVQRRQPWQQALAAPADIELAVNFDAPRIMLSGLAPEMAARGWGRILAIGSVQERVPRADMMLYAALKAAQSNMILNLAKELGPSGVTCNVLLPGVIETDRNAAALAEPNYRDAVISSIPARRLGTPQDCAGPALLLCSEAGGYVTGQSLVVDGGMVL